MITSVAGSSREAWARALFPKGKKYRLAYIYSSANGHKQRTTAFWMIVINPTWTFAARRAFHPGHSWISLVKTSSPLLLTSVAQLSFSLTYSVTDRRSFGYIPFLYTARHIDRQVLSNGLLRSRSSIWPKGGKCQLSRGNSSSSLQAIHREVSSVDGKGVDTAFRNRATQLLQSHDREGWSVYRNR